MILLPQPYPDEVIGSVLARGARHLGLSWARLLHLATGRSVSSVPLLMPFALGRLARCTGVDPEELLERHTLFPYTVAFMSLERRQAFKSRALKNGDLSHLDALAHVVTGRTPFRRLCPVCAEEDLRMHGETYWRRAHLLPGVFRCLVHDVDLRSTTIPLQGGRGTDACLPADAPFAQIALPLSTEALQSITSHSVRAMIRPAADRNWLQRYWVAAFALGYQLRRRAVASTVMSRDLHRFYGDAFLTLMCAPMNLSAKSAWPALLVRPHYPVRLATPKHVLMLTFLEHASPVENLDLTQYRQPGPMRRDYTVVDRVALRRMRSYLKAHTKYGRRLTVRSLVKASGEAACMKRFRENFPRSLRFLAKFRLSKYAARRVRVPQLEQPTARSLG